MFPEGTCHAWPTDHFCQDYMLRSQQCIGYCDSSVLMLGPTSINSFQSCHLQHVAEAALKFRVAAANGMVSYI